MLIGTLQKVLKSGGVLLGECSCVANSVNALLTRPLSSALPSEFYMPSFVLLMYSPHQTGALLVGFVSLLLDCELLEIRDFCFIFV